MENKSNRGTLIKEIIENTIEKNIFEFTSEFKKILQNELDTQLPFETLVSIELNGGQVQPFWDFLNKEKRRTKN
jgi:hypothetical protein